MLGISTSSVITSGLSCLITSRACSGSAAWPTTFYGQLAAVALGDDAVALARRIAALHDPAYSREQVLAFTDREVVRAAAMLVAWNDPHRARAFLLRMDELAPDPADRTLTARFALQVGLPDTAVFVIGGLSRPKPRPKTR